MSDLFIDLGIETDPGALEDEAINYLQAQIEGWEPNPGNLEVIQIEAVAPMAADQASIAAEAAPAIFRNFGTKLAGIPYLSGAPATAPVVFTLTDTDGHTIPANTDLTINGLGFFLLSDVIVPSGSQSASGIAVAVETGAAFNNQGDPTELVTAIDWVSSVTTIGSTSGGVDAEDDDHYQNRLAGKLRLQAPTIVTAQDAAAMALSFQPAAGTDQQEIGRAVAIDLYSQAASGTFTATTANGSNQLTSVSSTAGLGSGTRLSGAGIPTGTVVLSVAGSTVTMSKQATASASGVTITAQGLYQVPRAWTVFATGIDGLTVNADTRTALSAWLSSFREANFVIDVQPPTYTPVYVTFSIHIYPHYDPAGTAAAAQAAVLDYLSPTVWGNPDIANQPDWLNDTAIRYNKLLGIIEKVPGVDYVPAGSLQIGTAPSPSGTSDLTIPGPAPLPQADATTVPLPTVV